MADEVDEVRREDAVTTGVVLTTFPMPLIHTCSACGVQWSGHHECPSVNRSTSAPSIGRDAR